MQCRLYVPIRLGLLRADAGSRHYLSGRGVLAFAHPLGHEDQIAQLGLVVDPEPVVLEVGVLHDLGDRHEGLEVEVALVLRSGQSEDDPDGGDILPVVDSVLGAHDRYLELRPALDYDVRNGEAGMDGGSRCISL